MDITDIIVSLPEKLKSLCDILKNLIFGTIEIAGQEYSFWLILGGVGIIALIIYSIIKS